METPQEKTVRRNYKSDLNFLLRLKDCNGNVIGWPGFDWTAKFWTSMKANTVVASCISGETTNCFNDNGVIHIVLDNHKLSPGKLQVEFTAELPNEIYEDGNERIVEPLPLDVELIREAAPCPEEFEIEVMLPYIKGDKGEPFTYADFTEEQLADLRKPAEDAASDVREEAQQLSDRLSGTVNELVSNTQAKVDEWESGEQRRAYAEELRVTAEANRETAERTRNGSETERNTAESNRATAESKRIGSEAARTAAENARHGAETQRMEAEAERQQAEQLRATAEAERADKALYGSFSLDFGTESTQASDFNLAERDISIVSLSCVNVASITVATGDEVLEFTPEMIASPEPFTIRAGANSLWQITRTAEGEQAAIGVRYKAVMG